LNSAEGLRAHPYYWAGFVHIGKDVPLELAEKRNLWWVWVIAVVAVLAVGVFVRKRATGMWQ